MKKVRIGIVGLGNMGTTHAQNITKGSVSNMKLTAISDISELRRNYARDTFQDVKIFDSADEMFDSGLIDAVIIAVPHYEHSAIAISAFKKGLNVMVEKPAGVYTGQVREMNDAAAKSGTVFGIMYNQRTNPMYRKLREMIQRGELGHIKRVTWIITDWYRSQAYHDSSTWRSTWKTEGGGALINQNPHQLDLWQWLFGMPDRIYSKVSFGKYYDIEVEDDVMAYFEYDNGTTGEYITSTGESPGTNRLEIACDMGKVIIENDEMLFYRNTVSERDFNKGNTLPFGKPECWKCEITVDEKVTEQHNEILKNFANAIINGTELIARGEEGIHGLTISNAIHLSTWTNETVNVKDFPDERFYEILQDKIKKSTVVKKECQIVADTSGTY